MVKSPQRNVASHRSEAAVWGGESNGFCHAGSGHQDDERVRAVDGVEHSSEIVAAGGRGVHCFGLGELGPQGLCGRAGYSVDGRSPLVGWWC